MVDPRPEHAAPPQLPKLIAWETTRACPLACKHCRATARPDPDSDELSTAEGFRLLESIASFAKPTIILTGGEPMMRHDIYDLAAHARDLGLSAVMAPCGLLLNDETAARLKQVGINHISISLDAATAEGHDAFRGVSGAFAAALRGIEAAKRAGLGFQINTTVTRHNVAELPAILDLAIALGATVFNPFLLVPTGRGRLIADQEIDPAEYEKTLQWFAAQQNRPDIRIRVTCAPHYQRILRQAGLGQAVAHAPQGCLGGKSFAFVSSRGKVQICGFMDVECGDLRRENFDFQKIWNTSEIFLKLRNPDSYGGRCGYCEFRQVCGGCRARAFAVTGDYSAEEPFCTYAPRRGRGRAVQPNSPESPPAKPHPAGSAAGPALDKLDKALLTVIQTDLPVAEKPFDVLAGSLGTTADDLLARLSHLREAGLIRRLGPVFDSRRLGYVSTLVAAKVPAERLAETAQCVNRLPGVTHNYQRQHAYNLWFTLTAPSAEELQRRLDQLRQQTGLDCFYSLPAVTTYKIRVAFDLNRQVSSSMAAPTMSEDAPARLDGEQQALVRLLQDDLPLVREPFAASAAELGWPVDRVLDQIRRWLAEGVIRRFGAAVEHRRLGFTANGMAVFVVAPQAIDGVGRRLAEHPEISHCYRRPPLPDWPYTLFAMVHGSSEAEVRRFVYNVARELGLADFDVLFSTREYKKTSNRYFLETLDES
jgi:heme b synthase